jgi:hypothetical protein
MRCALTLTSLAAHGSDDKTIQAFFIHYRTLISYPWPERDDNSEQLAWPTFKTLGDWEKKPSTKLQTAINIIVHFLGHDNASHPTQDVHGNMIYPDYPNTSPGFLWKILMYGEYPMMAETICTVSGIFILAFKLCNTIYLGIESSWGRRVCHKWEYEHGRSRSSN